MLTIGAVALMGVFASCDKTDNVDVYPMPSGVETRAHAIGFDNAEEYAAWVRDQHDQGNHENCDVMADGSHRTCVDAAHNGQRHDGTHHNGTAHGAGQNHNGGRGHNGERHH